MLVKTLAAAVAALAVSESAFATIVIGSSGQTYFQNFDSLAQTGTSVAWTNDSTMNGWSLFSQPAPGTAITAYAAGNGSINTGSFYSFGAASSGDRALGGVGSGGTYFGSPAAGSVAGWIAVALTNVSGQSLNGFSVSFNGEQWRDGGNTTPQTMVLEYGFGASFGGVASWVSPGGMFDWASVVNTATGAPVDGNTAGLVSGRGGTIGTTWNAGDTLWLRWTERNDLGNDHGLAIDNFTLTAGTAVVPLPAAFPLLASALAGLGWFGRRRRKA